MKDGRELHDLIEYYRSQGAPEDQQMLAALLREAQESGGCLTKEMLDQITAAYQIRESILRAMIRRLPALRYEDAPHTLEICASCGKSRDLIRWVEAEFSGKSGCGFVFRTTGCMKNCRKGPSVRWDGELYSQVDEALLRRLTGSAAKR